MCDTSQAWREKGMRSTAHTRDALMTLVGGATRTRRILNLLIIASAACLRCCHPPVRAAPRADQSHAPSQPRAPLAPSLSARTTRALALSPRIRAQPKRTRPPARQGARARCVLASARKDEGSLCRCAARLAPRASRLAGCRCRLSEPATARCARRRLCSMRAGATLTRATSFFD
jgi:hypothetical protein